MGDKGTYFLKLLYGLNTEILTKCLSQRLAQTKRRPLLAINVTVVTRHPLYQSLMAPLKCLPSRSGPFLCNNTLVEPALSCFRVILAYPDLLLLLCPVTLVFSLFITFFLLVSYRFSYTAYKTLIIIMLFQSECSWLVSPYQINFKMTVVIITDISWRFILHQMLCWCVFSHFIF